jgi:hypothetical protein
VTRIQMAALDAIIGKRPATRGVLVPQSIRSNEREIKYGFATTIEAETLFPVYQRIHARLRQPIWGG